MKKGNRKQDKAANVGGNSHIILIFRKPEIFLIQWKFQNTIQIGWSFFSERSAKKYIQCFNDQLNFLLTVFQDSPGLWGAGT